MDERLGFIVSSVGRAGRQAAGRTWTAPSALTRAIAASCIATITLAAFGDDPDPRRPIIDRWIAQQKLPKLADLWVQGLELDWNRLHGDVKPRRMTPADVSVRPGALLDTTCRAHASRRHVTALPVLHPLLHRNTSDLGQQRYTTVRRRRVLPRRSPGRRRRVRRCCPAVAYLEMARAALMHRAAGDRGIAPCSSCAISSGLQPIVVAERGAWPSPCSPSDGRAQLGFEVYSLRRRCTRLHCQGSCVFADAPAPASASTCHGLRAQMHAAHAGRRRALRRCSRRWDCTTAPPSRASSRSSRRDDQLLVRAASAGAPARERRRVRAAPEPDGQRAAGLDHADRRRPPGPGKPSLPFALESLRILAPCTGAGCAPGCATAEGSARRVVGRRQGRHRSLRPRRASSACRCAGFSRVRRWMTPTESPCPECRRLSAKRSTKVEVRCERILEYRIEVVGRRGRQQDGSERIETLRETAKQIYHDLAAGSSRRRQALAALASSSPRQQASTSPAGRARRGSSAPLAPVAKPRHGRRAAPSCSCATCRMSTPRHSNRCCPAATARCADRAAATHRRRLTPRSRSRASRRCSAAAGQAPRAVAGAARGCRRGRAQRACRPVWR